MSREPTPELAGPVDPGAQLLLRRGHVGGGGARQWPTGPLSDRWSQVLCRWPQPRAGNAGQAAAASTTLGQCTWAQALRQAGKATCPCLAHGSPRARGQESGGRWAPSLAAPLFPPGLASVLLSLLSLVYLSQVLPQKLILTKDSHRIRVSLRSGLGQDAPQWHPGCLCPRPTVQNN